MLEWTVTTFQGELIWVETVTGTATGSPSFKVGAALRGKALEGLRQEIRAQMDAALADLFHRSFEEITRSPEIQRVAVPE